jgi:PAS domain S-box-containing protein
MSDSTAAVRRFTTHGLLAGALLLLLLLPAFQLGLSYQDKMRSAEISTRNLAAIFDARLDAALRRTDADLQAVASEIPRAALRRKAVARYAGKVNRDLNSRLFNRDEVVGYRVHDANGDTLYGSGKAPMLPINIADRAYFRQLRDDPQAGLVFSAVLARRSTGRPVLVVARALRDAQGKFLGSVNGLIELEYYRQQFKALDLGMQGIVALRRRDSHALVVRVPDLPGADNAPLAPDHPVVQRLSTGEQTMTLRYSAEPDYIPRIMGIQAMANYPFYFAVGVGRDEVLAGWRKQALVVGLTTLLLFGLLAVLLRRLSTLRRREAAMLTTLAQSAEQFRNLAEIVPVGICRIDLAGKCCYVNGRYLELTGRSRDELLGRDWSDGLHPDDREAIGRAWGAPGVRASAAVAEYRLLRPDGQLSYVLGELRDEFDDSGRIQGYLIAHTDITRRREIEAELLVAKLQAESANLDKTRFLAAVSHDLRQPIQAINLFRDALGRTALSAEQRSISNFLALSVHSLGEMLYALLDISKLDAGLFKPQLKAVPVDELFAVIDAEFSPLALSKGLRFKLYSPFGGLALLTDPGIVFSVLRNLIDNAFKYTHSGGVLVGARRRGDRAVIQVWDTGIGIAEAQSQRIFDACFQVDNGVRDRSKGLGLGLSIAQRMAQLLGGELGFRSRLGRGTVFEVSLPLAVAPVAEAGEPLLPLPDEAQDRPVADLSGRRVVVVEDDAMVAKAIEVALQHLGVDVTVFADAEQALAWPGIFGADFYLSDFTLPGANGLELLNGLAQVSATTISAALMTGETSPQLLGMMRSSRWPVLVKPVGLASLLALLQRPSGGD